MFQLRIGDKTLESLKDFEQALEFQDSWAAASIDFCLAWIKGEEFFNLQTSGSTGKPKVIEVSRQQMISSALATRKFLGTGQKTKILNCLQPDYIAGKMNLVRGMVWNCQICCEAPSNDPISAESLAFDPDFITVVPTQVLQLLKKPEKTKSLKHILIGGAPLSERQKMLIADSALAAWQTYGMTETVSHIALAKIDHGPLIYQALPEVQIGQSEDGCLWIKSAMSGNQVIQTTDLVALQSDSRFIWKGRRDFVINSGGIKLHPEELEPKIEGIIQNAWPGSSFFLTGIQDDLLGEKLVLVIEGEKNEKGLINTILKQFETILSKYEVPKDIYFVKDFSKTTSGKLDRKTSLKRAQLS